jgi:hypothetical protein
VGVGQDADPLLGRLPSFLVLQSLPQRQRGGSPLSQQIAISTAVRTAK